MWPSGVAETAQLRGTPPKGRERERAAVSPPQLGLGGFSPAPTAAATSKPNEARVSASLGFSPNVRLSPTESEGFLASSPPSPAKVGVSLPEPANCLLSLFLGWKRRREKPGPGWGVLMRCAAPRGEPRGEPADAGGAPCAGTARAEPGGLSGRNQRPPSRCTGSAAPRGVPQSKAQTSWDGAPRRAARPASPLPAPAGRGPDLLVIPMRGPAWGEERVYAWGRAAAQQEQRRDRSRRSATPGFKNAIISAGGPGPTFYAGPVPLLTPCPTSRFPVPAALSGRQRPSPRSPRSRGADRCGGDRLSPAP